jgi:peptide/nickel transport system substrate-binding protein
MMTSFFRIAGAIGLAAMLATPALAQKSKDTLRLPIEDPFSSFDSYLFPNDEVGDFVRNMYSNLIAYDEHTGKYVPDLAKAWRRVDPTTLEFDLREDVVFHSGNKFTSDDVKYMFDYLKDPQSKIRFPQRYNWVKEVETMGPYKLRIVTNGVYATDLSTIAYRIFQYDSKIHRQSPENFGRLSASGSGPFKMVSLDRNAGNIVERFDGFFGSPYRRAPIKRIHAIPMADEQTQIAQLLTGGLDVLRNVTGDNARELAGKPNIKITAAGSKQLIYILLDGLGRSPNKAFTDERVRKAFMMAIDRAMIIKTFVAGGELAEQPAGICFKSTVACAPTTQPVAYDPAGAKKLLAEAGYPNGIDITLSVYNPINDIAIALSGELRKVGIRASVEPLPTSVYIKKRDDGGMTAFMATYPTGAQPTTDNLLDLFFVGNRDYWKDPVIAEAMKEGAMVQDEVARGKIYARALDQVNQKSYIYPFSELPIVYAHSSDIRIEANPLTTGERRIGDYFWN